MKLISCDHCGVVLDADKLTFANIDQEFDKGPCFWSEVYAEPRRPCACPACGSGIDDTGEVVA